MAEPKALFGVAGWSYEDWKGIVYPRNCKDTLRAVAQRVGLIEINSTFYGLPSAKNCRSWIERTADLGTQFTAKLPKEFTHDRQWNDALLAAQCARLQVTLITSNAKDFRRLGRHLPVDVREPFP